MLAIRARPAAGAAPAPYASASEALLYGLLFLSLGVVAWNICDLGMDVVDRLIPDPVERVIMNGYDTTNSGLRWPIATLIWLSPLTTSPISYRPSMLVCWWPSTRNSPPASTALKP